MINTSLAMIVVLFCLANISYFLVLPFDVVRPPPLLGLFILLIPLSACRLPLRRLSVSGTALTAAYLILIEGWYLSGLDFGRALAGPVGALLFALIVSISCLGALNSSLYTSSYVRFRVHCSSRAPAASPL